MSEWYKESVNQKKQLIQKVWDGLAFTNMYMELDRALDDDGPVNGDGYITLSLGIEEGGIVAKHQFSFRSIYIGHEKYIAHVLKAMALQAAKKYFNIS